MSRRQHAAVADHDHVVDPEAHAHHLDRTPGSVCWSWVDPSCTPIATGRPEDMEAELPVVATRVGGLVHLLEDCVHGLLVPRRDPAALAEALDALLGDPVRRRAMGAAGRDRRRAESTST